MKNKTIKIKVISRNGFELFNGTVNELPLKEDYILSMSIKLFNDREPCIIHRTFIAKKFYCEVYEKLKAFKESGIIQIYPEEAANLFNNIDLDMDKASIYID